MGVKEVVLVLLALAGCVLGEIVCKNEKGHDVDWWVMIKLPQMSASPDPDIKAGLAYLYADANNSTLGRSYLSLAQNTTGALANTLAQLYDNADSNSVGWMMYNDQLPGSATSSYAHSKGVVTFDEEEGFWLVHSVPRFPVGLNSTDTYYFPSYETNNGQSFLCVTYYISVFDTIGKLFQINKPNVFEQNFPEKFDAILPNMNNVLENKWVTTPSATMVELTSKGKRKFSAFAKNSQWNQDLYEGLVSPTFKTGLLVQSWREGSLPTLMPTFCTPNYTYDSINVLSLQAYDLKYSTVIWSYTKDHSKWAVTQSGTPYVCIGDINRMFSQYIRGGGTVCFDNTKIWQSFTELIANSDTCVF